MATSTILSNLKKINQKYLQKLYNYDEATFCISPPQGGWSYSEVYFHIFDASILSLQAVDECLKKRGKDKPTLFVARLILFFGAFPPAVRLRAPKQIADRIKKVNKAEAKALILQFQEMLEQTTESLHQAEKNIKNKHPRLGYLNAKQWLRFIQIHLNHHLKQLKRIEKRFRQSI